MVLFIQQVKEDRWEEEDKDGKLCPHVSERWSEIMFEKIIANFIYIYIYIYNKLKGVENLLFIHT
jgi:hypothetical protein